VSDPTALPTPGRLRTRIRRSSRRGPSRTLAALAACAIVLGAAVVANPSRSATAAGGTLFTDGFESGDFGAWSSAPVLAGDGSATVQTATVKTGTSAARFSESSSSTSSAYLRQTLSPSRSELRVTGAFQVITEGATGGNVPLIRLFSSTGTRLISLYRQNATGGKLYVQHSGAFNATTGVLPISTWATIDLHVIVAGATSTVEVALNGGQVYATTVASLGADPVLNVQLGNDTKGQAFALAADDIVITDGSTGNPSPSPSASASASPSPSGSGGTGEIRHVIWVLFENKESTALTASSAPYFTSFASTYANFTNFYARFHPSLPNYLASWSGSNQGVTNDTDPNLAADNLSKQLSTAGKQWRSYAQNYSGTCNKAISIAGTAQDGPGVIGDYVRRHNPPMEFTSVSGSSTECANIQPLANFDPTVDVALVVPNLLNDMHDGTIAQGDAFLQAFVPLVTSSPDWAHTLLVVTFDEGTTSTGGGGHVYTAAAAPWLSHQTISTTYDHYNLLRTTEDIFGLPALGNAATAAPITELYPSGPGGSPSPSPSPSPSATPSATPSASPSPSSSPGGTLFADDFESGAFGAWTVRTAADGTAAVQSGVVKTGSFAARLTSTATANSSSYARAAIPGTPTRMQLYEDVRVISEGSANANVPLVRLFDASGNRLVSVFRQNAASNKVYVSYGGTNYLVSGTLPLGSWTRLGLQVLGSGASTSIMVQLDGLIVYQATTATLPGIASVQIGNDTKKQAFDVAIDNVSVIQY
jgi:hypothetical protein